MLLVHIDRICLFVCLFFLSVEVMFTNYVYTGFVILVFACSAILVLLFLLFVSFSSNLPIPLTTDVFNAHLYNFIVSLSRSLSLSLRFCWLPAVGFTFRYTLNYHSRVSCGSDRPLHQCCKCVRFPFVCAALISLMSYVWI